MTVEKRKGQARLRLVFTRDADDRRYAQSTAGQFSSHGTSPPDSRSISTARDSPQGFTPYATFIKCPSEVPQREANARLSETGRAFRYSRSFMGGDYHCTVTGKATPFREFTGRCVAPDNRPMKIEELPEIRRANLRRYLELHLSNNLSELARRYRPDNPRPSFFSDLLRGKKHFGEKLAFALESCLDLKEGQLSMAESPLELRQHRRHRIEDLKVALDDLHPDEQAEAMRAIAEIRSRRKVRRRA
jgi:hypothetical protein